MLKTHKKTAIMMLKRFAAAALGFFAFAQISLAQSPDDPVLFSVDGTPVLVSEFKYIYSKTNQDKADFSEASLKEYLDLYTKFKLKVARAKAMKLDTIPALRQELEGYRRQLANSYLVDKEVTERLIREAYDRSKKDVELSHIFFKADKNALPADTVKAFEKAKSALARVIKGEKFETVAAEMSDDPSAKENKGRIGFFNAPLPDGFYPLETALYTGAAGKVSDRVIRTSQGYHVVRVEGERPARGEVEIAQILFRTGEGGAGAEKAKMRADSVIAALKKGADWNELCAAISEDKATAPKGGSIGSFGINRFQKTFEEAAFSLQNVGDISATPVQTSIGFHVLKLNGKKGIEPFEKARRPMAERVKRDSRAEIAKQNMIARIKKDGGFKENTPVLGLFSATLVDSVFLTFKWKPQVPKAGQEMFSFSNGLKFTLGDFEDFCQRAGRARMQGIGTTTSAAVAAQLYKQFVDESCLKYEEGQLDKKYPEFKNLMREYEEGILLFDATKQLVWDKANVDSVGLEKYFNTQLRGKYEWEERMTVGSYVIKTDNEKLRGKIVKAISKKSAADVLKKFNKVGQPEVISFSERTTEKSKLKESLPWIVGHVTEAKMDDKLKAYTLSKVEKILPKGPKSLNESRGYAVADYQDWLEKQWVEELRKAYKIDVNEAAFRALIKK